MHFQTCKKVKLSMAKTLILCFLQYFESFHEGLRRHVLSEVTIKRLKILQRSSFIENALGSENKYQKIWKLAALSDNFRGALEVINIKLNYIFAPILFFVLSELELRILLLMTYFLTDRHIYWINSSFQLHKIKNTGGEHAAFR